MALPRVLKIGLALTSGQGISVLYQLLMPPLYIRNYGVGAYGEWLTLYSAVNYLVTLNLGIHTFANNAVCIAHNRGEREEVLKTQATAFAILASVVILTALGTLPLLFLPISDWLHLELPSKEAGLTAYLLGLQVFTRMLSGFITGSFLAVGMAHRRENWNNFQSLLVILATAVLVLHSAPFSLIAALQLVIAALCVIASGIDLWRVAPTLIPNLRFVELSRIVAVLKPSSYFALLFSSNFLVYEMPVLLIQRILGPTEVVVFSISRTICSMARQALLILSSSISPEIVELFGRRNWSRLFDLYEISERVLCILIPTVSVGTFLATPILMALWVHKPTLYHADVSLLMALISAILAIKEQKYQFQASVNEHSEMARFCFLTYVAMTALSIPGIHLFGTAGFLILWLGIELVQFAFILSLNRRLFRHSAQIQLSTMYRLFALLSIAFADCAFFAFFVRTPTLLQSGVATAIAVLVLPIIAYQLFGGDDLKAKITPYLARRFRAEFAPTV